MEDESLIIEGLHVVAADGLPRGYVGVYEPGQQANPGPQTVIVVDLDTYVRLHAGEELVVKAVTQLAIDAKRAIKVKAEAQERRDRKTARRLQKYVGAR